MLTSFREVLGAVDPTNTVRSAQQLLGLIGEAITPLSLRRLMHRALAFRMRHQGLIQHVFVLMLENRSFDHVFGYSGIEGTDSATDAPTEVDGLTHQDGANMNPATDKVITTSQAADFNLLNVHGMNVDVEHEFVDVLMQLCGPAGVPSPGLSDPSDVRLPNGVYPPIDLSGFVADFVAKLPQAPPEIPMQCFDPAKLPVLNTLAREFVICDHWFASHPGPTWPNRFFVHAASPSTDGQADSPPDSRIAAAFADPLGLGPGKFHFPNGTIYDRLAARNKKHAIYRGNKCPQISGLRPNHGDLNMRELGSLGADLAQATFDASYVFIEPDNGLRGIAGAIADCDSVKQNDMHPPSDVRDGEALIKEVYETIRNSPVWDHSVLVVTFDEHGGFFDHMPPPAAIAPGDGGVDNTHHFQFNQLGVRVPAVIVSPWVGRNVIDHTVYDHTSLLASVENLFGLAMLTQRDAAARDFLEVFSRISPRTDAPTTLPSPSF